ncbi:T9SS type A sorting domain-containing protein, partial [candidate division WOR-3 bacterium]|nr:T9SS type A sorting domain-containing protein [candidate division WOR-3 bacterium]
YHYNLFGDPALRQYGRLTSIEEVEQKTKVPSFAVYPNPTSGLLTIQLHSSQKQKIELDVYDESGRFVQCIYNGYIQERTRAMNIKLPAGVYFLRLRNELNTEFKKLVIVR